MMARYPHPPALERRRWEYDHSNEPSFVYGSLFLDASTGGSNAHVVPFRLNSDEQAKGIRLLMTHDSTQD